MTTKPKAKLMSADEARALITKHGGQRQVARNTGISRKVLQRALARDGKVKIDVPRPIAPATPRSIASGGVALSGVNVYEHRPTDYMKAKLYSLKRGLAYPIDDLSRQWGISADSISKHAMRHGARRYVELRPGDFVACVLHPETAAQYKGGEA